MKKAFHIGAWYGIHCVTIHHLITGALLLLAPQAAAGITSNVIPVRLLSWLMPVRATGVVYLAIAIAVLVSFGLRRYIYLRSHDQWLYAYHVSFAAAQQMLVAAGAAGSMVAIWTGAYLDGTVVPWGHTLGDQGIYVLIALLHLGALWEVIFGDVV